MPREYGGLRSYSSEEVEIIDEYLSRDWIYFNNEHLYGVFHWALIKEELLDDLLELDEVAYQRFLKIIKSEKLVEPDFQ